MNRQHESRLNKIEPLIEEMLERIKALEAKQEPEKKQEEGRRRGRPPKAA